MVLFLVYFNVVLFLVYFNMVLFLVYFDISMVYDLYYILSVNVIDEFIS